MKYESRKKQITKGWYSAKRKRIWQQCKVRGDKVAIHNAAMMLNASFEYNSLSKNQIKRYHQLAAIRNSFNFGDTHYGWHGWN